MVCGVPLHRPSLPAIAKHLSFAGNLTDQEATSGTRSMPPLRVHGVDCALPAWLVHRSHHEHTAGNMPDNLALARRLLDSWNRGDVAAVPALVTPEVEIETPGGVDRGLEAARRWVEKHTQPTPSCTS